MENLLSIITKEMVPSRSENGSSLYEHSTKEYFHTFFQPVNARMIKELQMQINANVPDFYRYILSVSNGMRLFNNQLIIFSYIPYYERAMIKNMSVVEQYHNRTLPVSKEYFYFAKDKKGNYFYIHNQSILMMNGNGILIRSWSSLQDWFRDIVFIYEKEKKEETDKIDRNYLKLYRILESSLGDEFSISERFITLCTLDEMKELVQNRYIPIYIDEYFGATLLVEYGKETKEVYCCIDHEITEISPKFQTFLQSFKFLKDNKNLLEEGIDDEEQYSKMMKKLQSINKRKGFFYWVSWLEN